MGIDVIEWPGPRSEGPSRYFLGLRARSQLPPSMSTIHGGYTQTSTQKLGGCSALEKGTMQGARSKTMHEVLGQK